MDKTREKFWVWLIYSALAIMTLAVFWQLHSFEFINYDDNQYVTKNEHVFTGLTWKNVVWAFTSEHAANWHPLTGISHMLDCQLFVLKAGPHHIVNLFFHIASTLLLFTVLRQMTNAIWPSAFVATLFAVHPLHVESVAWIAERKDVLSTFFWLLTMAAYFSYVKKSTAGRYILTLALFTCGLMSKPMLVTLPFVLLLLDYWPLNRVENKTQFFNLFREKIPFLILSAISSCITFFVQKSVGSVGGMEIFPLKSRIANALISYEQYFVKAFWPAKLAVFYPHFGLNQPYWLAAVVVAMMVVITILVIRFAARYKYLPVGWFWYLGTLIPVIGLVQVGSQAMADRYTYVPLIGLFIIIAWGIADLTMHLRFRKIILVPLSLAVILTLSVCAFIQTGYWRDSVTLLRHTLKVTPENQLMDNKLGLALLEEKKYDEAVSLFLRALQLKTDYAEALNNIGYAYGQLGRRKDAIEVFDRAIKIKPDFTEASCNLAAVLCQTGQFQQAVDICQKALKTDPDFARAHFELGLAYSRLGRNTEALEAFNHALRINPDYAVAYFNIATVYTNLRRYDDAIKSLEQAIKVNPDYAEACYNLSVIYGGLGRYQQAAEASQRAVKINPNYADAYFNLGVAYIKLNQPEQAIGYFEQAVKIKPDYVQAHYSLCIALLTAGRKDAAEKELEILRKLDADKANALLKFFNK